MYNRSSLKIALVLCPLFGTSEPPISLAYLASVLRKSHHTIEVFDFNLEFVCVHSALLKRQEQEGVSWGEVKQYQLVVEPLLKPSLSKWARRILEMQPDIVCFSVYWSNMYPCRSLARVLKEENPRLKIVFGGPQCSRFMSGLSDIQLPFVDAVVYGEGEQTLPGMLSPPLTPVKGAYVKMGSKIHDLGVRKELIQLDSLPFPDFSSFSLPLYDNINRLPLVTSRGCFVKCVFCIERVLWPYYRHRSAKGIASEMSLHRYRYNIDTFYFTDSIINGSPGSLSELCRILIGSKLNVSWFGNAMFAPFMKPPLLREMREAGCTHLVYGIESGSQRVLNLMRKASTIRLMSCILRDTQKEGIGTEVNFIVGFPGETEADFGRTIRFIRENSRFIDNYCVIGPCSMIPGTYLEQNPHEFGVSYDGTQAWRSVDGTNIPEVRQQRFNRLKQVLEEEGITPPRPP